MGHFLSFSISQCHNQLVCLFEQLSDPSIYISVTQFIFPLVSNFQNLLKYCFISHFYTLILNVQDSIDINASVPSTTSLISHVNLLTLTNCFNSASAPCILSYLSHPWFVWFLCAFLLLVFLLMVLYLFLFNSCFLSHYIISL